MATYHHPPTESIELHQVLSALGDATRIKIFTTLLDGQERTCSPLAASLGIADSTLTYHLRILREAGLTHTRPEGVARWTKLRTQDLNKRFPGLIKLLSSLLRA
ncbi:helix-turn-helix transcriptional regulator [Actinocrinis puniceicyclus]|uniref:Helix-turn-helix transcriptional regulator n=1 Tax=Actinocrinis puniceicyclus TaxID=977794 RepID=A0A8J7WSP3_9ACTN|nr:helix-turn-helix transcriptional regulator [Actinocrinis puniceicyclus]MBS2965757.1 helix-turn-helix transcriptional regulator [Actinocrinis puniceicyclus]